MAQQSHSLMQEGARQEDIRAAAASLAAAEAARAQAETALEDTRLLAPADGIILARVLEPGSMVTPQNPVYTLALPNPVYIRAYAAETQLGQVAPGTPVRVTTDSSAKVYAGKVGFVSPRAEFTPKSVETTALRTDLVYRLRIVVPDGEEGLRQGMPVTIDVLQPAPHQPPQDGD
jgi:HlyD family secretion protein